ncbi:MAG: Lrp/AsnC family transcriptional regulator [Nitrososphaerales archaeon]
MKLDGMNIRILNILQRDARKTVSEIARELKRAETTVRERIKHMERENVIKGYSASVDKDSLGYPTEALIFCNMDSEKMEASIPKILALQNVIGMIHVTGERRIVIRAAARSNEEMWSLVHHSLIPMGCVDVDSHVIMRRYDKFPPDGIIVEDI